MLLSHRHHDSRTHKIIPRATVKVASKNNQRLERDRVPRFAPAVCKLVNVGTQGRIDATRLFNDRLFSILLKSGVVRRALWDPQCVIYDNSPISETTASLSDVLESIREPQTARHSLRQWAGRCLAGTWTTHWAWHAMSPTASHQGGAAHLAQVGLLRCG